MLAASDDIATISDIVGVMSEGDLEHGMKLARLSGELRAAGEIVNRLEMPILTKFLHGRSITLDNLAVNAVLRSSSTRVLSAAIAATGNNVADLSAREVAEGVVRMAASDALATRSEELGVEAIETAMTGVDELAAADELGQASRAAAAQGVAETATGSAELGAAAVEGAIADSMKDEAQR